MVAERALAVWPLPRSRDSSPVTTHEALGPHLDGAGLQLALITVTTSGFKHTLRPSLPS